MIQAMKKKMIKYSKYTMFYTYTHTQSKTHLHTSRKIKRKKREIFEKNKKKTKNVLWPNCSICKMYTE